MNFTEARKIIEIKFPGINEIEAIGYARGVSRGLALVGVPKDTIVRILTEESLTDKLLEAGVIYMGLFISESNEVVKS